MWARGWGALRDRAAPHTAPRGSTLCRKTTLRLSRGSEAAGPRCSACKAPSKERLVHPPGGLGNLQSISERPRRNGRNQAGFCRP